MNGLATGLYGMRSAGFRDLSNDRDEIYLLAKYFLSHRQDLVNDARNWGIKLSDEKKWSSIELHIQEK